MKWRPRLFCNFPYKNNDLSAYTNVFLGIVIIGAFSVPPTPFAAASTVIASWYGPGFHGRTTASGERFNQWAMTAAHRTLPFGTLVRVSYRGATAYVRINDRGPFVRGRSLDLSKAAAQRLRCHGVCRVNMTVVGRRSCVMGRRR